MVFSNLTSLSASSQAEQIQLFPHSILSGPQAAFAAHLHALQNTLVVPMILSSTSSRPLLGVNPPPAFLFTHQRLHYSFPPQHRAGRSCWTPSPAVLWAPSRSGHRPSCRSPFRLECLMALPIYIWPFLGLGTFPPNPMEVDLPVWLSCHHFYHSIQQYILCVLGFFKLSLFTATWLMKILNRTGFNIDPSCTPLRNILIQWCFLADS